MATGVGFGAEKRAPILAELMADYNNIPFVLADGSYDTEPCPQRNTQVLLHHGLQQNDEMQVLDGGIKIFPSIYFCPISYDTGKHRRSMKTISIHWYSASWKTEQENLRHEHRKNGKNKLLYSYS